MTKPHRPFGTVAEEFKGYAEFCYPNGFVQNQEDHVKKAFIAGSMTMAFRFAAEVLKTDRTDDEWAKAIAVIVADAEWECRKQFPKPYTN